MNKTTHLNAIKRITPFPQFPALRSGPKAVSSASRKKQFPSNQEVAPDIRCMGNVMPLMIKKTITAIETGTS